jgi:hypothetical protein
MGEMIAAAGHHIGGIVVAAAFTIGHDVFHHRKGNHDRKITTAVADGWRHLRRSRTK